MSTLTTDCPRCHAKHITFDVGLDHHIGTQYGWQRCFEVCCICRHCHRSTVFFVKQKAIEHEAAIVRPGLSKYAGSINDLVKVDGFLCIRDMGTQAPPEHVPDDVQVAFKEGATCLAVGCWNAAGAMFRACVDLATRPLLPQEDIEGLNRKVRRDLGLRLPWLFANKRLPEDLHNLSACIKEDGNDGAHQATLQKDDALDLLDFTTALLNRLFTEPERLRLAERRRADRRQPKPE